MRKLTDEERRRWYRTVVRIHKGSDEGAEATGQPAATIADDDQLAAQFREGQRIRGVDTTEAQLAIVHTLLDIIGAAEVAAKTLAARPDADDLGYDDLLDLMIAGMVPTIVAVDTLRWIETF